MTPTPESSTRLGVARSWLWVVAPFTWVPQGACTSAGLPAHPSPCHSTSGICGQPCRGGRTWGQQACVTPSSLGWSCWQKDHMGLFGELQPAWAAHYTVSASGEWREGPLDLGAPITESGWTAGHLGGEGPLRGKGGGEMLGPGLCCPGLSVPPQRGAHGFRVSRGLAAPAMAELKPSGRLTVGRALGLAEQVSAGRRATRPAETPGLPGAPQCA